MCFFLTFLRQHLAMGPNPRRMPGHQAGAVLAQHQLILLGAQWAQVPNGQMHGGEIEKKYRNPPETHIFL